MNQPFPIDKPTRVSGRFGRLSYLAWLFISSIIFMVIALVLFAIFGAMLDPQSPENFSIPAIVIFVILYLVFIYFYVVFTIRRLHDRNHSGWLALLMLVPVLNIVFALYLVFAKGDAGSNNFGPPRTTLGWEKVVGWFYILMIPLTGVLAAIALPSYQSYVERSQQAQIQQPYNESYQQSVQE